MESMNRLYLEVPKFEELDYRKELLSQSKTMSYNIGYDVNNDSYNKKTGCINFNESEWANWYSTWIGNEPDRFYAYIKRQEDKKTIGEVNFHIDEDSKYSTGIIVESKYRGQGYSVEALKLLIKQAFEVCNISNLNNDFEITRKSAMKAHEHAGFRLVKIEAGRCYFKLTKEEYFNK